MNVCTRGNNCQYKHMIKLCHFSVRSLPYCHRNCVYEVRKWIENATEESIKQLTGNLCFPAENFFTKFQNLMETYKQLLKSLFNRETFQKLTAGRVIKSDLKTIFYCLNLLIFGDFSVEVSSWRPKSALPLLYRPVLVKVTTYLITQQLILPRLRWGCNKAATRL